MEQREKDPGTGHTDSGRLDRLQQERFLRELRDNQNLGLGVLGGVIGVVVGAALWAVVTVVTHHQIGWMAVGIGFLVGYLVRKFGKGVDPIFGIVGAALSLIGCLLGNLLTVCLVVARQESIPLLDLLARLNPQIAFELFKATFSPMDVIFYAIAVYEGYKFSRHPIAAPGVKPLAENPPRRL